MATHVWASARMPKMAGMGLAEMAQQGSRDWGLALSISLVPRCFSVCLAHMAGLGFLMVDPVVSLLTWFLISSQRERRCRVFESLCPQLAQHHFHHTEGTSQGQVRLEDMGRKTFLFLEESSRTHVQGEKEVVATTFGNNMRQLLVRRGLQTLGSP